MSIYVRAAAALGGLAALGLAAAAHAEDWITSGVEQAGGTYETDLSTLSRTGDLANSWMRHALPKPEKDSVTGKRYSIIFTQRSDDCVNHRFNLRSAVFRDDKGVVVRTFPLTDGWRPILPGSVGASVQHVVCGATTPIEAKPILTNLGEGEWRNLGPSADNTNVFNVRMDRVVRIDKDHILAVARSDYTTPQWVDGFPIRFVVTLNLLDCATHEYVAVDGDFYISSTQRVTAVRKELDTLTLNPITPGSFADQMLPDACATAATAPASDDSQAEAPEPGSLSSGTAWATDKGYLVTASHVIADGERIAVYSDGELVGEAKVVADDPANDVAVLKFATPHRIVILPMAPRPAALGRSVFTLGYPHPQELGAKVKMTSGQVSSTSGMQDDARFLQVSIPIQQGNSGGPVINWDGTVVGVVDAKLTRFEGPEEISPENVNYAVKVSYVRPMLDELPDLGNYTPVKPSPDHEQMVEAARKAVFMLLVSH